MTKSSLEDLFFNTDIDGFCKNLSSFLLMSFSMTPYIMSDTASIRQMLFINKGWRLTSKGLAIIENGFESYTISNESNKILTPKILLNMDPCVKSPWYVTTTGKVTFFNRSAFFELSMFDGNLNTYVESISPNLC